MAVVDLNAAMTHLSRLLDQAAAGEDVVIARAGKPVARLVAVEAGAEKPQRQLGRLRGQFQTPDDFDTMGQDEISAMFGMRR